MGFFKKLLGGKQKERETQMERVLPAANKIVNDYGHFMQSPTFPAPGCIADAKKLPYDKQTIKNALMLSMKLCDDSKIKEMLKVAYISLADFQNGIGETDVGLDIRKFPNPQDIDFNDRTQIKSVAKEMDSMMAFYEKFKKIVEEERRLLQEDVAQI